MALDSTETGEMRMSEGAENHAIQLLREMRREIADMRDEMRAEFASIRSEMDDRFDALDIRVDGLTHIVTFLAGQNYRLDERVSRLEDGVPPG